MLSILVGQHYRSSRSSHLGDGLKLRQRSLHQHHCHQMKCCTIHVAHALTPEVIDSTQSLFCEPVTHLGCCQARDLLHRPRKFHGGSANHSSEPRQLHVRSGEDAQYPSCCVRRCRSYFEIGKFSHHGPITSVLRQIDRHVSRILAPLPIRRHGLEQLSALRTLSRPQIAVQHLHMQLRKRRGHQNPSEDFCSGFKAARMEQQLCTKMSFAGRRVRGTQPSNAVDQ